jgi:hypothetical protein
VGVDRISEIGEREETEREAEGSTMDCGSREGVERSKGFSTPAFVF